MAKKPAPGDWTAIRIAQMREAGEKFGNFAEPSPDGKRVPQMDAEYARELLKYWFATATALRERHFERMTTDSRDRLTSAFDAFKREMQPFAATVLTESPAAGQSFMLSHKAVLQFFDAVGKLAFQLKASELAPAASDLWWQSVAEAARDVKNKVVEVVETGASWGLLALGLVAVIVLGNRRG